MYHSGNQLIDPKLLFTKVRLQENMHIADFGCGRTGHIVFPISRLIGEHGTIYAVDILKDVLDNITKRSREEGNINIHPIWSDIEKVGKTSIPEKSLDVVFLVNTLSHVSDVANVLNEANRLLKNKSRIIIADWKKSNLPIAPKDEKLVDFEKIIKWANDNNFAVQEQFDAGQYHEGLVLFKHD